MAEHSPPQSKTDKEAVRKASDAFSIARANAINEYASFEMHLGMLFETLLGADTQKSFAVFASILNTQARLKLIERLLHLSHGKTYDKFFQSLSSLIRGIDKTRNRIAHWIVMSSSTGGRKFNPATDVCLHGHPDIFSGERLYKHDIEYFAAKTDFCRLLVYYFSRYLMNPELLDMHAPDKKPWRDIFLEEVSYPPPAPHPLHRIRKKLKAPPRSSRA